MGSRLRSHRDLEAWREAMVLARCAYAATADFPKAEQFGLAFQIRRAAVSVPSNLAEGAARGSAREFAHYLSICLGSLAELDTQLQLAAELGWLTDYTRVEAQRSSVAKLTTRLRQSIAAHRSPTTDHRSP